MSRVKRGAHKTGVGRCFSATEAWSVGWKNVTTHCVLCLPWNLFFYQTEVQEPQENKSTYLCAIAFGFKGLGQRGSTVEGHIYLDLV